MDVNLTPKECDYIRTALNDHLALLPENAGPYTRARAADLKHLIAKLTPVYSVPLIIDLNESLCGGCGKPCLPNEVRHMTTPGWGGDEHGCGKRYEFTVTQYAGRAQAHSVIAMREDLPFRGSGWLDRKNRQFHIVDTTYADGGER